MALCSLVLAFMEKGVCKYTVISVPPALTQQLVSIISLFQPDFTDVQRKYSSVFQGNKLSCVEILSY